VAESAGPRVTAPDVSVTTLRSLANGMRALVLSDMAPGPDTPGRGVFVRDQVAALRRLPGLEVELDEAPPGPRALAALAARSARRRGFDIVHAHYGLTAWPALAVRGARRAVTLHGTDLRHPRTRRITLAALGRLDLVATASSALARELPREATSHRVAVLPCGVSLERFRPLPRAEARAALGLPRDEPLLLFPADPARAVKRHDLARAAAGATRLATLGGATPDEVVLWINAANAVLVPSDAEGFGLAVLEALACDVPVLATPVGIHRLALGGIPGALCAPFDERAWRDALAPHLDAADPRIAGRARAELFSATRMAERVAIAWREIAGGSII
jgi:teichuronic acid biosynthesis glycosyltransferase TuaC